jgi:hypothetical protein
MAGRPARNSLRCPTDPMLRDCVVLAIEEIHASGKTTLTRRQPNQKPVQRAPSRSPNATPSASRCGPGRPFGWASSGAHSRCKPVGGGVTGGFGGGLDTICPAFIAGLKDQFHP